MPMGGSQNSKSTTAHTNEREGLSHYDDSQNKEDSDKEGNSGEVRRVAHFNIEEETGERGAQPESNQIRDNEVRLIGQKKEKCLEIFRNNSEIREMTLSQDINPEQYDLS